MRELHEIGETHDGKRLAECPARRRERGELGIGRRQDDDVAWSLTEVDGVAAVGNDTRLSLEKMHRFVEREVAVSNDGLSVTSLLVVSVPVRTRSGSILQADRGRIADVALNVTFPDVADRQTTGAV